MSEIKVLTKLMEKIYQDAYLQGRQDGLEGLHIEPELVLKAYLNDSVAFEKLTKLEFEALHQQLH